MTTERASILVVDDEESIRESFKLILQDEYNVIAVASGEAALKMAVDNKIDLVFLDIRMPGMDGIETLQRLKKIDPQMEIIMVTAVNDVQKASESVKLGANNYIVKPFELSQILSIAKAVTRKKEIYSAVTKLKTTKRDRKDFPELSGESKALQNIIQKIEELSKTDTPVLILGENGTEKIAVAHLIHLNSSRKDSSFEVIDIPKNKNEKDIYKMLFGMGTGSSVYELEKTKGIIEFCDKGTILINNLQNAPRTIIDTIVQTIEKKYFKRYGASQENPIDIRFIFSANEDYLGPENLICESILIPPLRARREDIQDICTKLLEENNKIYSLNKNISQDALEILTTYPWPANYNELKTILNLAYLNSNYDTITSKDIALSVLFWSPAFSYIEEASSLSLEQLESRFEKEYILKILKLTNFEVQIAAKALDISKNILVSKIETLEIK